ncbi:hypothetical protein IQ269_07945 [Tychonema sp. LEGE 07199]|nr:MULTISPECIES: hypothetical protein [unclassified Tychonema]MBE9120750.1 hypothetical protein [Tychonema sp. LEGE 07199]MBE9133370.1 hypothetical protein [Tychonema sp. LEGE 07196]
MEAETGQGKKAIKASFGYDAQDKSRSDKEGKSSGEYELILDLSHC